MTVTESLLAFTLAAAVLAATPGVDTALVLRTALARGSATALAAALGVAAGCLFWGGVVALGLGALLASSPAGFDALKWLGAAYLVWQGVRLWRRHGQSLQIGDPSTCDLPTRQGQGLGQAFGQGLFTNVLNPKVGLFYLTLLPLFVPAGVEVAGFSFLLAAIHVGLSLVWFALLIALAARARRWLARPRVLATLDRLTGALFIGFGLRLASGSAP